jgi:plastocyanin
MARTTPTPAPRAPRPVSSGPAISIFDNGYDPAELRLRAGQSVTWSNDGALTHDVSELQAEPWRSGPLSTGQLYRRVFASPGQYDYFCSLHPTMRGRVTVEP